MNSAEETFITFPALGANPVAPGRWEFRVWAPQREKVELHIVAPAERRVAMTKNDDGYHEVTLDAAPGTRYFFNLDGTDRPDPASRFQPEGVHGPSELVASDFAWRDAKWKGIALEDYVIYELHVGTFTREGTFDAIIPKLRELKELGITAIELLPIAQFPGSRNWGYDGTYVSAVQSSYGGAAGLKRLVDAAHQIGLAVLLDVVYNHLGPEGNYLSEYGPYFTDRYKTPWGLALNFDGAHSDHVRWYFIHSALMFIDEFHIDGLRVDAVHAIIDHSAEPFLQDLTTAVRERASDLGRKVFTIAESDLNDPRVITPKRDFGIGFDAQWTDDFHHALHVLLTGERDGYYVGFQGVKDFARVWSTGYLYTGQHSIYRNRRYGLKPRTKNGAQFVVCMQNHDQVGNRMTGDRLASLVPYEKLRIAAAAVVLSPFLPMLFMGEEYGEKAPFQYFTSHSDPALIEAVRKGRAEEFDDFEWKGEPPDPHAEETFEKSKLNWELLSKEEHAALRKLYADLLRLRREIPSLRSLNLEHVKTTVDEQKRTLLVQRGDVVIAFNFSDAEQTVACKGKPLIESGAKVVGGMLTMPANSFALMSS
jgi:maltooligosyltrehalose trehalohydrolase